MTEWLPALIVALVTGLLTLAATATGAALANRRSNSEHRRELAKRKYEDVRAIYTESIAIRELFIRTTERLGSSKELDEKLARNNALLYLISTHSILEQVDNADDILEEWSRAHRHSQPERRKVRDGEITYYSTADMPHQKKEAEKANELYPKVIKALAELVMQMKIHLQQLEPK